MMKKGLLILIIGLLLNTACVNNSTETENSELQTESEETMTEAALSSDSSTIQSTSGTSTKSASTAETPITETTEDNSQQSSTAVYSEASEIVSSAQVEEVNPILNPKTSVSENNSPNLDGIDPIYPFIQYLEENIKPQDWGGYDTELSEEDDVMVLYLYITNSEVVEKVIGAYTGQLCRISKHYTDFSIEKQDQLTNLIKGSIVLKDEDAIYTQTRYSIYSTNPIPVRQEDPYIFVTMVTDDVGYYEQQFEAFYEKNQGTKEKIITNYLTSKSAEGFNPNT